MANQSTDFGHVCNLASLWRRPHVSVPVLTSAVLAHAVVPARGAEDPQQQRAGLLAVQRALLRLLRLLGGGRLLRGSGGLLRGPLLRLGGPPPHVAVAVAAVAVAHHVHRVVGAGHDEELDFKSKKLFC